MSSEAAQVRPAKPWWRRVGGVVWARRFKLAVVLSGYLLARLCDFAPDGWLSVGCELLHRLLKVVGA